MLNIERYRTILENYDDSALDCDLDCNIYEIRKKCEDIKNCLCISKSCSECRKENIEWLLSEYKEPILDDAEKRYLRGVIRPFRNIVVFIQKTFNYSGFQWIEIAVKGNKTIALPGFRNDEMYKGMELDREYTLEELGL